MVLPNYQYKTKMKFLYRRIILHQLDLIRKVINRNVNHDLRENIIIFGSPRSGTTWLFNILNQISDYSGLYEPLNLRWFPFVKKLGLIGHKYLFPSKSDKKNPVYRYFSSVFQGQCVSLEPHWPLRVYQTPILFWNYLIKRISSKNLVVKFVRANRLLPWLVINFPNYHYIYLYRHPCAVIASQIQSKICSYNDPNNHGIDYLKSNKLPPKKFLLQELVEAGIDQNICSKIEREVFSPVGILAIIWCVDNLVPLNYFNHVSTKKNDTLSEPWLVVSYEHLLDNFSEELNRIASFLGKEKDISERAPLIMNRWSPRYTHEQKDKWRYSLSHNDIQEIFKIVDWFNISLHE